MNTTSSSNTTSTTPGTSGVLTSTATVSPSKIALSTGAMSHLTSSSQSSFAASSSQRTRLSVSTSTVSTRKISSSAVSTRENSAVTNSTKPPTTVVPSKSTSRASSSIVSRLLESHLQTSQRVTQTPVMHITSSRPPGLAKPLPTSFAYVPSQTPSPLPLKGFLPGVSGPDMNATTRASSDARRVEVSTATVMSMGSTAGTLTPLPTESSLATAGLGLSSSFFENRAAVAGVFASVAFVVAISLGLSMIFCMRRRRKTTGRHWLAGVDQAVHSSTWRDEGPPLMRSVQTESDMDRSSRRNTAFSDESRLSRHSSGLIQPNDMCNIRNSLQSHSNPFSDHYASEVSPNSQERAVSPAPSTAPSTPSIYPATLPPQESVDSFYAQEMMVPGTQRHTEHNTEYRPLTPQSQKDSHEPAFQTHHRARTPPSLSHFNSKDVIATVPRGMTSVFDEGPWNPAHSFTQPPEELFMKRKLSPRMRSRK